MQSGDMYMWQAFGATNLDASSSKSADKSEPGKKVRSGVDMRVIRRITVPSPEKGRPPSRARPQAVAAPRATPSWPARRLCRASRPAGTLPSLRRAGQGKTALAAHHGAKANAITSVVSNVKRLGSSLL